MSKALPTRALATTLLALVSVAAQAQAQNDHAAHGQADAQTAAPSTQTVAPAADPHAGHATSASGSTAAPAMDHGNMQMQGGSAPPDARDPHGYSNGLTLGSGDYAVPGVPRLMLADEHRFFSLRGETLERRFTRKGDDSTAYDLQAWYGTTYNKAVVKAEGDIAKGKLEESRTELLWGHAVAPYWDTQLGVRVDNGEGPSRQWLAFGIQGLAPYWFELEATGYVGSGGRTALRVEGSYELLLTQRLILEPRAELQFYGKDDRNAVSARAWPKRLLACACAMNSVASSPPISAWNGRAASDAPRTMCVPKAAVPSRRAGWLACDSGSRT